MQDDWQNIIAGASKLNKKQYKQYFERQILNSSLYLIDPLLSLPQVKVQFMKMKNIPELYNFLKLLRTETYATYKTQKDPIKLTIQQIHKLKQVSLLSIFCGKSSVSLYRTMKQIDCSKQQTIRMMMELNISKLINISIAETKNMIEIYFCKIRERDLLGNDEGQSKTKAMMSCIEFINEKNNDLLKEVKASQHKKAKKSAIKSKDLYGFSHVKSSDIH